MKTTVIAFENRKDNACLFYERQIISALNSVAVYVDKTVVLSADDEDGFALEIDRLQDVTVILNKNLCSFDFSAATRGLTFDGDGFSVGKPFVSVAPENTDGYAEKLLDKLRSVFDINVGKMTFKVFGVDTEEIKKTTDKITADCQTVFFNVTSVDGDTKVDMFYGDRSPKMEVDKAVKSFILEFKNNIYAEDDVTVAQRFYDLMKLRRLTCSTAESMTGGKIASLIVEVDGASDIFYEGMVTYSTLSKERRLNVSHKTVVDHTVVSSEVAYEMAVELLKNVDVAVTITGYAGSDVHPSEEDGLCFIGIGVKDKIEVYRFKFGGKRVENIARAAKTSLYLALKTVENSEF